MKTQNKIIPSRVGEKQIQIAFHNHLAGKVQGRDAELVGVPFENLKRLSVSDFSICENIFAHHLYYSSEKLFRDVSEFRPQVTLEQG